MFWSVASNGWPAPQRSVLLQSTPSAANLYTPDPGEFQVRIHPDGPLYVGDIISFEISSPAGSQLTPQNVHEVQAWVEGPISSVPVQDLVQRRIGSANFTTSFNPPGLNATLSWAWDTGSLEPGWYQVTFATDPTSFTWEENIQLLPGEQLLSAQQGAHWASVETNCCQLNYITGTQAERDLSILEQIADEEANKAAAQMGVDLNAPPANRANAPSSLSKKPVVVNLIPRVIGNGGFTTDQIYISYLDRNYADSTFRQVLHHEIIHVLDAKLGGDLRPALFVEGLAVYESGGHFKPEPIVPRAAAAVDLGLYLPLKPLIDSFYSSQHEIGYLEGAALVTYLVQTYGWKGFNDFYRDIHATKDGTQSTPIDNALQKHFQITLVQLENRFIQFLKYLPVTEDNKKDLQDTIQYYDTVRRYQEVLDPSAYFRQVWLPNADQMRKRGIVADYLRHPENPENIGLESLLVGADADLRSARYDRLEATLKQVPQEITTYSSISPILQILGPEPKNFYLSIWEK
ncbi:MAG TPA: hypothetical protein VMT46_05910 [Anaerolineaceae bacterium]|nr:hypothetical protein [Anaerolineaceae bacterium]